MDSTATEAWNQNAVQLDTTVLHDQRVRFRVTWELIVPLQDSRLQLVVIAVRTVQKMASLRKFPVLKILCPCRGMIAPIRDADNCRLEKPQLDSVSHENLANDIPLVRDDGKTEFESVTSPSSNLSDDEAPSFETRNRLLQNEDEENASVRRPLVVQHETGPSSTEEVIESEICGVKVSVLDDFFDSGLSNRVDSETHALDGLAADRSVEDGGSRDSLDLEMSFDFGSTSETVGDESDVPRASPEDFTVPLILEDEDESVNVLEDAGPAKEASRDEEERGDGLVSDVRQPEVRDLDADAESVPDADPDSEDAEVANDVIEFSRDSDPPIIASPNESESEAPSSSGHSQKEDSQSVPTTLEVNEGLSVMNEEDRVPGSVALSPKKDSEEGESGPIPNTPTDVDTHTDAELFISSIPKQPESETEMETGTGTGRINNLDVDDDTEAEEGGEVFSSNSEMRESERLTEIEIAEEEENESEQLLVSELEGERGIRTDDDFDDTDDDGMASSGSGPQGPGRDSERPSTMDDDPGDELLIDRLHGLRDFELPGSGSETTSESESVPSSLVTEDSETSEKLRNSEVLGSVPEKPKEAVDDTERSGFLKDVGDARLTGSELEGEEESDSVASHDVYVNVLSSGTEDGDYSSETDSDEEPVVEKTIADEQVDRGDEERERDHDQQLDRLNVEEEVGETRPTISQPLLSSSDDATISEQMSQESQVDGELGPGDFNNLEEDRGEPSDLVSAPDGDLGSPISFDVIGEKESEDRTEGIRDREASEIGVLEPDNGKEFDTNVRGVRGSLTTEEETEFTILEDAPKATHPNDPTPMSPKELNSRHHDDVIDNSFCNPCRTRYLRKRGIFRFLPASFRQFVSTTIAFGIWFVTVRGPRAVAAVSKSGLLEAAWILASVLMFVVFVWSSKLVIQQEAKLNSHYKQMR